jgi:integrase/recombinase XerC
VKLRMFWMRKFAAYRDLLAAVENDFYDFLATNPNWSPSTKQTIVSSIKVFYRWAHMAGHTSTNLAIELQRVKVPRTRARIATDDLLLDAIEKASLPGRAMLRLGGECGLRVAEIAALDRSCRVGPWLTVLGKGGQARKVHLSPEVLATLIEIEQTTMRWGFYFPGRARQPISPSTVWRHVRAMTGLNTHALRHRAGTVVYRRTGNDLRAAQEFLGHASPTTTAIYVHVDDDDLERSSEAARLRRVA